MSSNAITLERNKTAIRNLFAEVINAGRPQFCDRYLAPDRVDHQDYGLPPGAADGHEGFRRVLGGFTDAFPDLTLTIDFMVADDDKLVVYITTEGTHRAPFMGAPATGRHFSVKAVDIFAFNDNGLVSEHWGVFDTFGMMRQLGLIPPPEIHSAD